MKPIILILCLLGSTCFADMGISLVESERSRDDLKVSAVIEEQNEGGNRVCSVAVYYKGELLFVYQDLVNEKRVRSYSIEDIQVDVVEKKNRVSHLFIRRLSDPKFKYHIKNDGLSFKFSDEPIQLLEEH